MTVMTLPFRTFPGLLAVMVCLAAFATRAEDVVPPPRTPDEALAWYAKAAAAGQAEAQFLYAVMLEQGLGAPDGSPGPDPAAAVPWYEKAAQQGHVRAQYRLATLLYSGQGTARNPIGAARWFAAAAERGHPPAQYDYALMLERGRGIAPDPVEAARWYERAALGGIAQAAVNLGALRARDLGDELPRNPAEALSWFDVAAGLGATGLGPHRSALVRALPSDRLEEARRKTRDRLRTARSQRP